MRSLITALVLYYVFTKIDFSNIYMQLLKVDLRWLALAVLVFNISQIVSAVRLNQYFKSINLNLKESYNLALYYVGMFYNLFLPGGIGGDGYKIYHLHKRHHIKVSDLFTASVLDRISGLIALLFLITISINFSSFAGLFKGLEFFSVAGSIVVFTIYLFVVKKWFAIYVNVLCSTNILSLVVQLIQIASATLVILSLNVHSGFVDYLTLFLISSIVVVLPVTVSGVGARELTFVYGFGMLGMDVYTGIAFAFIFFNITAVSSLIGALFLKSPEKYASA